MNSTTGLSLRRKICVFTGTRADYGLLNGLMHEIAGSDDLCLQLLVTGSHLCGSFGMTVREIEADGFHIDKTVEILMASDSPTATSKAVGLGMIGYSEACAELSPDIVVILGDRFEAMAGAMAAVIAGVPIAHIHGGETTEGAIDEAFRHSITKMAFMHFTSTDRYRERVIQMGEDPRKVFSVGAPGLDRLDRPDLLRTRSEFETEIEFKLAERAVLVTYHPETLDHEASEKRFAEILRALESFRDISIIFTYPNADPDGQIIIEMILQFVARHPDRAKAYASLGQRLYFSALHHMDGVIGNSSSGIIEAPSFDIGTIDIGDRQKGRVRAASVINCDANHQQISSAIQRILSVDFKNGLKAVTNPYRKANTAKAICQVLKTESIEGAPRKSFHDIPVSTND